MGVKIEVPETTPAATNATELTLPSGTVASIRQGTGRDLRMAQAVTGQPFDAAKFEFALIAQVATFGGKRVTLEQIDAMPIGDVLALQAEVNRVNFPTAKDGESAPSNSAK